MIAALSNSISLGGWSLYLPSRILAKLSSNLSKPDIAECKSSSNMRDYAVCSALSFTTSTRAGVYASIRAREGCPAVAKNGLLSFRISDYPHPAPAKSGVRIGVLDMLSATYDAPCVFFYVVNLTHPFFGATVIIRVAHKVMVGWMGAEKSAPVSDNAGYANPVQSTTSEIGVSGGGIEYQLSEAAIMATILTQTKPKFEFRFMALSRADMQAKPCRISIQADSEKEARRILAPNFILSLAARLPVITSDHQMASLPVVVTISTIKSTRTCPKWIHLLHFAHPANTKAAPRMAGNPYLKVKQGGCL